MPKICSFRHFPGLDSACYHFEATRFASFKTWPQDRHVSACALSKNGWYYSDDSDDDGATTFCCKKRCKDWAMGDNPVEKHKLLSPLCPLARGQDMWRADGLPVFNIPIPTADAPCVNFSNTVYSFDNRHNRAGMVAVQETGGQVDVDVQHRHLSAVAQRLGVRLRTPNGGDPRPHPLPSSADGSALYTAHCEPRDGRFPTFASLEKRILTFQNFPRDLHLDIEAIAKLGFFYTDFKDYIICFKCALGLFNLTPGDDPALEHARLEPFCLHFRLVTGNTLIREAQRDMIVTGQ